MPDFRPIAVSIVDFLGCFLPGCVWLVVIYGYDLMLRYHAGFQSSFFSPMLRILSGSDLMATPISIEAAYYVVLILLAGLLGFAVKPIVMRTAEWCSRPESWFVKEGGQRRFPYRKKYVNQPYFNSIIEAVRQRTGCDPTKLPGSYEPFSACKRILKQSNSALWEESEHTEAEARMLGSVFLAVVLSVVPVIVCLPCRWLLVWSPITFWLGYGFRRSRQREIDYCYLNFLIVIGDMSNSQKTPSSTAAS
jgi:hypothetical protein